MSTDLTESERLKLGDLYVIEDEMTGCFKVGRSVNVDRRLRALQTASPGVLQLRLVIKGAGEVESDLHEAFRPSVAVGEWFAPQSGVSDFVRHWSAPSDGRLSSLFDALGSALVRSSGDLMERVAATDSPGFEAVAAGICQRHVGMRLRFIAKRIRDRTEEGAA